MYLFKLVKLIVTVLCLSTIVACGGGGGSSGGSVGSGSSLSDLEGVWEFEIIRNGIRDEYVHTVNSDGRVEQYDYFGDDYDDFADCYFYNGFIGRISHLGGNDFRLVFDDGSGYVELTLGNNQLTNIEGDILNRSSLTIAQVEAKECDNPVVGGSVGSGSSLSDLEGVWEFEIIRNGIRDEYVHTVDSDGRVEQYDYFGDDYDDFADCYFYNGFIGRISHLGGNDFRLVFDDGSGYVELTLGNNQLTNIEGDILNRSSLTIAQVEAKECDNPVVEGSDNNTVNSYSDIVGLWDETYEFDGLTDVIYSYFASNGSYSYYDYLGDEFDNGPNCYLVFENIENVSHLGNNRFSFNDGFEFSVNREGANLVINDEFVLSPPTVSLSEIRSMECNETFGFTKSKFDKFKTWPKNNTDLFIKKTPRRF